MRHPAWTARRVKMATPMRRRGLQRNRCKAVKTALVPFYLTDIRQRTHNRLLDTLEATQPLAGLYEEIYQLLLQAVYRQTSNHTQYMTFGPLPCKHEDIVEAQRDTLQ